VYGLVQRELSFVLQPLVQQRPRLVLRQRRLGPQKRMLMEQRCFAKRIRPAQCERKVRCLRRLQNAVARWTHWKYQLALNSGFFFQPILLMWKRA
jgi:hypothetical protein